jgi:hypothetical protein
MNGPGTAPARTEADLRAALAEQARQAPSAHDVLSALPRAGSPQRRLQLAWAAPIAAAAAMVLVIGLAVAVSHGLFATRQPGGAASGPAAPLPFYVTTNAAITKIVVRSTATGKVTAVVPVNPTEASGAILIAPALATGANGTFYVAALQRGVRQEQIYRFRLTAAGHVAGFARVPGPGLRPGWAADALAASADGSRMAVGASYNGNHVNPGPEQSDQVVVINTHTGAQRVWQGGSLAGGYKFFRVGNLSWARNARELAVLGAWCRQPSPTAGDENCSPARQAQLRAINPAGPGGSVVDGRLLLGQARHTYLAQALVSPNGSVITAMVLRGKIVGNPDVGGMYPAHLSVEQMSATGRALGVIYRRYLGDTSMSGTETNPLGLIADATGSHLILDSEVCGLHCNNEFNGWLDGRRLVPLLPTGFAHREAAEAW